MGCWGFELFQSDSDFDILSDLSGDMGVELCYPEDPAAAKAQLESGVLTSTFDQYLAKPGFYKSRWECQTFVLLAAAAMQLGAKIEQRYLDVVERVYRRCGFFPPGQKQIKKALKLWKNDGTPFDLYGADLLETANMELDKKTGEAKDPEGEDGPDVEVQCEWCDKVGKELKRCALCKKARYCDRHCQKEDWEYHSFVCVAPKKRKLDDGDVEETKNDPQSSKDDKAVKAKSPDNREQKLSTS